MRTLFWTCVVVVLVTYMFAVLGVLWVGKDLLQLTRETSLTKLQQEEIEAIFQYWKSLQAMMNTLIQVLTLDSFHSIMYATMRYSAPYVWIYFYFYVAVVVFVLMNLVTAIIVENAVKNSRHEEEEAL